MFFLKKKETKNIDTPHVVPDFVKEDIDLYSVFVSEYDSGNLEFNNLNYRKGAVITGEFGINKGFKYNENGEMEWGWARIHTGVDRASGGIYTFDSGKTLKDVVVCPFNFDRTKFNEYGKDVSYGTLIQLFNDDYQFEMRIAHMNPEKDILPWSLKQFRRGKKFGKDWVIGSAGTYGASTGKHTHTEFKSMDEKVEVFEILLFKKFGSKSLKEYNDKEVIIKFKHFDKYKGATDERILKDWSNLKRDKKVFFANDFLTRYIDWDGKPKTRYASNLLFNGL